jgi:eukaryotic-like serine/threonine-protein kinase
MALNAGQKLGPYEVIAPVGAGGMGEVYKAKDTRLDRTVAIKVLPTLTAQSADMRSRFDREAKAISSLNHPNICTLHDIGHQDGIDFLVMEYIDGDTLAFRLTKGALSVADLFTVAGQIADALDKAHKQGLVHRDLKPGNIMLTKSGAKLLDFGLAKLQQVGGIGEGASGATRTSPLTGEGTLIGTVQYMSPEQLEGKEADARSDIFAFGAVLYEMATGQRAFEGSSQASLIGSIMKEEPKPISAIQSMTPPALELVVKQCLAKDPDNRWQSAGDLRRALQWVSQSGSQLGTVMPKAVSFRRKMREWAGWAIATLAIVVAVFVLLSPHGDSPRVLRAIATPPEGTTFLFEGDNAGPPVVSPDGSRIAFVAVSPGGARIWVRELSTLTSHGLAGTEGASFPFWSPDSKSLGFFAGTKLMRVDISTGQVFSVCEAVGGGRGGSWGQGDIIVFSPDIGSPIFSVSAAGGTPVAVTQVDTLQHSTHRWPFFLPDGQHFLFFAGNHFKSDSIQNGIWFSSLDGTDIHLVLPNLTDGAYADGRLLFVRDSVLFVQEFDATTGRLLGEPMATRDRVQVERSTWKSNFSACENNILVYQVVGGKQGTQLLMLDRSGNILQTIGAQGNHYSLDLSPNGSDIVYTSQEQPYGDLYHFDLDRNLRTRLTFESFDKDIPTFSPSGDIIAFSVVPGALSRFYYEVRTMSISGLGTQQLVAKDSAFDIWPFDWSPDGRYLLCGTGTLRLSSLTASVVTLIPMVENAEQIRLFDGPGTIGSARFSPDGRWIAYSSPIGGTVQIFVIPSPTAFDSIRKHSDGNSSPGRWQISTVGGSHPRWRGDSRELYYIRNDGTAMAVNVSSDKDGFHVGHETELFRIVMRTNVECWDVSSDGKKFVVDALAGINSAPLVVVQNWAKELEK